MTQFVAFLRAINVGGHIVKMDQLRAVFESLGLAGVQTVIASGNVIFETRSTNVAALEKKIEKALQEALGYEVTTFLRSTAELREIAEHQPFKPSELTREATVFVAFLGSPPDQPAQEKLMTFCSEVDDFAIRNREIYWLRRRKVPNSPVSGVLLEKILRIPATVRNITTVKKLAEKCLR